MPTCCGEVIKNTAGGKDFYFCRGCKQEPGESRGAIAALMLEASKAWHGKAVGKYFPVPIQVQFHGGLTTPPPCPHSAITNNLCNACGVNVPVPGLPPCLHPHYTTSSMSGKKICTYCGLEILTVKTPPRYCSHANKMHDVNRDLEICQDCGFSWVF